MSATGPKKSGKMAAEAELWRGKNDGTRVAYCPTLVKRVLIVDDDTNLGKTLAIGLELEGFVVTVALNAEAALAVIADTDFDVAIVDLMLPGVNGIELARQLRRRRPETRVLLSSAYHLSEAQLRRVDCGIIGFIPKPFALDELADFLRAKTSPESVRKKASSA